jgi:hypothetical protein
MGQCNCGGKIVKFTPGKPKKATIPKKTINKNSQNGGQGKVSSETKKLQRQARAKALRNSGPCSCTQ